MITRDLREAIARAVATAGLGAADPGLRPAGGPGRYASSVAFEFGHDPREIAGRLAEPLAAEPWISRADVTGPGYLTVTVTTQALAALADRIAGAGPDSARSEALHGRTLAAPAAVDLFAAATWEEAREALAVELTARLAAAAGATVFWGVATVRSVREGGAAPSAGERRAAEVTAAIAFAGPDAVRFSLARAVPGRPVRIDPEIIARHVPGNPAYAVRYAHARAASGVRWAATPGGAEAVPRRLPADPGELALLDALSWLPERVATAARRGRPDEFARYLEELASVTIATLSSARHPGSAPAPGSDRLALARAAQAGLAAGLELLGVSAPDRM
ncbi:MAG TPA: DALR anticodon-binding domain-containing protein [Trebonia sp.]|nr:DALR anticodon-binding domain-containing protein [Trebonia sp.]